MTPGLKACCVGAVLLCLAIVVGLVVVAVRFVFALIDGDPVAWAIAVALMVGMVAVGALTPRPVRR